MLVSNLKLQPVINNFKHISLGGMLLLGLIGCQTSPISIEQVSQKKIGKTVRLTGKVVHLAPFVDNAAYQVEDATGKIWVVTSQNLPEKNQMIAIEGQIEYQSLPFAEKELGDFYLVELDRITEP